MHFNYFSPTKVVFGAGVLKDVAQHVTGKNVLLVTGGSMVRFGVTEKIKQQLEGKNTYVFSAIVPNPPDDIVDAAADFAREKNIDCVIGLGGGSPLDAAKAVACLVTNEGKLRDYRHGKEFANQPVELIAVPTTSGTGSEVTCVGVYNFENKTLKQALFVEKFFPKVALVDPELTYSMPAAVTAATGLDALCHAIESYWDTVDVPQSDAISMVAVKKVLDHLETAVLDENSIESKIEMSAASLLAGNAFSQTPLNICHAVSNPLTTYYGLEHGFAAAMTLIPGIKLAIEYRRAKMELLAKYCGLSCPEAFIDRISELKTKIGCPTSLKALGAKKEDFDRIIDYAFFEETIHTTPGNMTREKLAHILDSIF